MPPQLYQDYIIDRWNKGIVDVKRVGETNLPISNQYSHKKVMNYVAKYCLKGSSNYDEIQMWSQGLGSKFIKQIGQQVISDPTMKDLKYYDFSSNSYQPIVIDKVFVYYAFRKSDYKKYLDSRRFIERFGTRQTQKEIKQLIEDGELVINYAPVVSKAPHKFRGDLDKELDKCMRNVITYSNLNQRMSVFLSLNIPKIDKKTFKEIRNLRLQRIEEQIAKRIDIEKL